MALADMMSGKKIVETKKETVSLKTTSDHTKQTVKKSKKNRKYLSLDVTNYQDYVSLMADYTSGKTGKYKSMTQYILDLIEADKKNNLELYTKLKEIEEMKHSII
jgi:hypothetical protein